MNCTRCHGLMVKDHFMDFEGTHGHMWASAYRCMNCGNVHDSVIEQHRRMKQPQVVTLRTTQRSEELVPEEQPAILRAA